MGKASDGATIAQYKKSRDIPIIFPLGADRHQVAYTLVLLYRDFYLMQVCIR
jgi:hypothetical protein